MVFISPSRSHGVRCGLTTLHASVDPPLRALEFRRFALATFLLFLHPDCRVLPEKIVLEVHERRSRGLRACWNGLAYVV